ncbi:Ephrin type-B receptor 1 [Larimichthys crocea]|uniref:Uncharacterized protein n=1 Tax=Larimichthys crocea TaxID=215358 RepID=A0ACD3RMG5_LARCR|nr:Ephrin type-B receptor 1 [Larimichthys crocea]
MNDTHHHAAREFGIRADYQLKRGYDENLNTIRTYQVCNVFEPSQNNWLLTTYIDRRAAQRIYVEIRFTVRDCASIPSVLGSCKETFNLYYLETDRTVSEGIKGVEYWANAPFLKVDTIAADESFSQVDFGGRLMKVNTEVRSFGPLSKGRGFHLAFQDLGACMSLLAVRVFYKKCPSIVQNFAFFPETLTGAESTSLVIARGSCIPNAEEVDVPIKLYCNGDGEWMVPIGSCSCKSGYEPDNGNVCRACPQGTFKSFQGAGLCQQCPLNSRSTIEAATLCGCRNGYYRGDMDKPEDVCTSVPSAPRNLVSVVNQTSVLLEWHAPRDIGHRDDLSYNVLCRRCHSSERRACQPCDDSVAFVPGKRGLKEVRVEISKLRAHTSYTFDIQKMLHLRKRRKILLEMHENELVARHVVDFYYAINCQIFAVMFKDAEATSTLCNRVFIHSLLSYHVLSDHKATMTSIKPPNGIILDYEIRYYDKSQTSVLNSSVVQSETPNVVLEGLRPGTGYVVQVRARTVAGYGAYSKDMLFQTLTDDESRKQKLTTQNNNKRRQLKESVYGDKLQQYNTGGEVTLRPDMFSGTTPTVTFPTLSEGHSSPGVKIYIDPFTYEDPNEAVREFAKEIDPSCVKIEEVIGSGEFGEVYKGRLKPVGKKEIPVAIKTLKQNDGQFPVIQLVGMLRGIASGMRRRRLDSQAEHVESKQRLLGQQSNAGEVRQVQRGKSPETGRGRKIRQTGTGTLWQEGHNRKSGRVLPQGYKAGKPGKIMTD